MVSMFPAPERALDLNAAGAPTRLTVYQTPAAIRRTGKNRLVTRLRSRQVRYAEALAATAVEAAERQHTPVAGEAAIAKMVHTLTKELVALHKKISETDKLIECRPREHEHELAEVITSMPGIGTVLGAEFLVGIGSSPGHLPRRRPRHLVRGSHYRATRLRAGQRQSPPPHRYHRRLGRVFYTSAFVSIQHGPDSRRFHDG